MSWQDEYSRALKERDQRERPDTGLVDAYTRLADRVAALEAEKALTPSTPTAGTSRESTVPQATNDSLAQLRSELAETLRSKGQLQLRLKRAEDELENLRLKNKSDVKLVRDLSSERAVLLTKLRDRDEELRGKTKLLEDVQNEMVPLHLQLNMTEKRSKDLEKENKDLIKRWMERIGQEADAINNASKFS